MARRLLLASSSFSSSSSSLLSLGCVGEISRCFSVLQKGLWEVSAESTGLVGEEKTGEEGWGVVREEERKIIRGGKEECVGKKGEKIGDTVKSRSSLRQINGNQLQRTGDGIASLKIQ